MLQNEFGTDNEDVCMVKILEGGEYQASSVSDHNDGQSIESILTYLSYRPGNVRAARTTPKDP